MVLKATARTGSKEKLPSNARAHTRDAAGSRDAARAAAAPARREPRQRAARLRHAAARDRRSGVRDRADGHRRDGTLLPVTGFLHRLRTQTRVVGDNVKSSGRLFSVDTVNLGAGEEGCRSSPRRST